MSQVLPSSQRFSTLVRSLTAAAVLTTAASIGVARADCNEDLSKLMSKRMTEIAALNKISKQNGGKLDPIAACPRLKNLAADEGEVVGYMTKNKDWCNLPDDIVQKMSESRTKTATIAVKACGFAVKMKQAQQQQAQQFQQQQQQQAVKLPTGPL